MTAISIHAIGTTLQRVSKARSSKERILAFSLWLSLLAHGLFFPREWLAFAALLGLYGVWQGVLFHRVRAAGAQAVPLGWTDLLLFSMAVFSLLGLLNPVKVAEGWLEAGRWLVFWLVYRLSRETAQNPYSEEWLITMVQWTAVAVAVAGWLPWVNLIWSSPPWPEAGRLSSFFGYPNATAAFLGAALLLPARSVRQRAFVAVSFLSTGSRAALAILLPLVFVPAGLRLWQNAMPGRRAPGWKRVLKWREFWQCSNNAVKGRILPTGFILAGGLALSLVVFYPAWEHLRTWGFALPSWGQRLLYYRDGLLLAWQAKGMPRAGGWFAFPTVQEIPYWTADPHSAAVHVLLSQGVAGFLALTVWGINGLWQRRSELWQVDRWNGKLAALLFMAMHSLVDADFSFGALGILFWFLVGFTGNNHVQHFSRHVGREMLLRLVFFLVSVLLFSSGLILLKSEALNQGAVWSAQALRLQAEDRRASIDLWQKSLYWDQTQPDWRRQLAELKFQEGDWAGGLSLVEEVLSWQGFEQGSYEWAQATVLKALEKKHSKSGEEAQALYQWVERIPARMEQKALSVSPLARRFWPGWTDFRPTPHIRLMAEFAREKQLTARQP